MKALNISLSIGLATLLLSGCGEAVNHGELIQATKVSSEESKISSANAFLKMLQYKTDEQMKKAYPKAYALNHNFKIDIEKVKDLELLKEHAKAKVESVYIQSMLGGNGEADFAPPRIQRIINGTKTQLDDVTWKFIVSLQYDNQHACGGSLIDKEWIVTAAHCVMDDDGSVTKTLPTILANTYSLQSGVKRETDAAYVHPLYLSTQGEDGDIALLHLKKPLNSVETITLSTKIPDAKTAIKVAGWGNMSTTDMVMTEDLMEVTLPVIATDVCKNSYATDGIPISKGMICAGFMDGSKDSCQGDSGGPLIVNANGKNMLAGVVSFGGSQEQSCGAPNYPGVYTSVSTYANWISKYLTNSSNANDLQKPHTSGEEEKNDEESSQDDYYDNNASLNGDESMGYENDFSDIEAELEPIFQEIEEAKNLEDLKSILKSFLISFMQMFS